MLDKQFLVAYTTLNFTVNITCALLLLLLRPLSALFRSTGQVPHRLRAHFECCVCVCVCVCVCAGGEPGLLERHRRRRLCDRQRVRPHRDRPQAPLRDVTAAANNLHQHKVSVTRKAAEQRDTDTAAAAGERWARSSRARWARTSPARGRGPGRAPPAPSAPSRCVP